jgi:polyisoprenoid-binding protein YceI
MRYIFILIFLYTSGWAVAQGYTPQRAKSHISFKIKNFGSTVDGTMSGLKGSIQFDPTNISGSRFDVTLDANTIDTGINMRDNHLRKRDYFDVVTYPMIRFVSTKVSATNAGEGLLTGTLIIKNVSKVITFPFKYTLSNGLPQFTGEFTINRRNFNVGGSSISMGDEVRIILNVSTSK